MRVVASLFPPDGFYFSPGAYYTLFGQLNPEAHGAQRLLDDGVSPHGIEGLLPRAPLQGTVRRQVVEMADAANDLDVFAQRSA